MAKKVKKSTVLRIIGTVVVFAALIVGIATEWDWRDSKTVLETFGLSTSAVILFALFGAIILRDKIKDFVDRHKWAKLPRTPIIGIGVLLVVLLALQNVLEPMIKVTLFTFVGELVDLALHKIADLIELNAATNAPAPAPSPEEPQKEG